MNELLDGIATAASCGRLSAALLLALGATAAFAAERPAASPASAPANGLDAVVAQSRASSGDNDFLPPDQAFRFAALADGRIACA